MYVWRGKNRRDKRNLLLSGEHGWGCEKGASSYSKTENEIRLENENKHVEYYDIKIRLLMEQYMNTNDGKDEILLLLNEIEKEQPSYLVFDDLQAKELLFDIYKSFCVPDTTKINKDGLRNLMINLNLIITKKLFDYFIKKLNLHKVEVLNVDFESFYKVLSEEVLHTVSKNKSILSWNMIPFIPQNKNIINYQQRLKENASKILLVNEAVSRTTEDARKEYRKVHPSKIICVICDKSFIDEKELIEHTSHDKQYHKDWLQNKIDNKFKYKYIENIFLGNQGRRLIANRLIFSKELHSLQSRIDVAIEEPYRPNIADINGKRYEQQVNSHAFVTGYDPKSGIRPTYRQSGMIRQHLAPIRNKTITGSMFSIAHHPQLQEVIHQLLRCKDEFIDTVSTCDNSANQAYFNNEITVVQNMFAIVRFEWNGFAKNQVYIIGEFTGWKPEEMICNAITNKFIIIKQLSPGKYKYRFLIEEKEYVDEISTKIEDASSKCGYSNELLVINTPLFHSQAKKVDGNILLYSLTSISRPDTTTASTMDNNAATGQSVMEFLEGRGSNTIRVYTPLKELVKQRTLTKQGIYFPDSNVDVSNSLPTYNNMNPSLTSPSPPVVVNAMVGDIVHMSKTDKAAIIQSIQSIELRNMALFDDGAWTLASHIGKNRFIKSIDLSYNSISDEGIQAFSSSLPLIITLNTLKLSGNGFAFDGCRFLCNTLSTCSSLTYLELSNNRLGDDGMECICKYLHYNENLQELYVDTCLIGNDGLLCLHDALHINRKLKRISLSGNKFGLPGIAKLCKALEFNAALKNLNLSVNVLGPEACNIIGLMLVINDSIETINLNHVDMMGDLNSSFGIHGLCQAINTNHTLKTLLLRNNHLKDEHVLEIACSLTKNKTLLEIDLSENLITNKDWLDPYRSVRTLKSGLEDMPSISKSLKKNRKHLEQVELYGSSFDKEIKIRLLDDEPHGKWTFRRQWMQVILTKTEKLANKKDCSKELKRIELENEYIKSNLEKAMISLRLYLHEKPCVLYLQTLSKCISQYIYDLPLFDSSKLDNVSTMIKAAGVGGISTSINDIRQSLMTSRKISSPTGRFTPNSNHWTQSTHTTTSADAITDRMKHTPSTAGFTILPQLSSKTRVTNMSSSKSNIGSNYFVLENFLNAHICIISSIFNKLYQSTDQNLIKEVNPNDTYNFHSQLMLHPLLLQQAFQLLALPLPANEVQDIVDITKVPGYHMIGLHKLSDYILHNANRLSKINKLQRLRILADMMMFNPPLEEAIEIILDYQRYCHYIKLRDQYRKLLENKPLYQCTFCRKRFAKQEFLDKHISKGLWSMKHKRHRVEEVIHHSQLLFLQQIKSSLTNVLYPAYYELKPSKELPRNYFPQVFDMVGSEGRPFGVVEADRTIRVLDVFGEYLQVSLQGRLGWIHYCKGTTEYLRPLQGFDWNHLHIQEDLTYYRVNDLLPKEVELKVRYQPYESAEILGYLKRNHVVECMAVIGDWLQIRYENEDAAWVKWIIPEYTHKKHITTNNANTMNQSMRIEDESYLESGKFSMKLSRILGKSIKSLTTSFSNLPEQPQQTHTPFSTKSVSFSATDESGHSHIINKTTSSPNNRAGLHTPGERLEGHDEMFSDHILSYEINNRIIKVNIKKKPYISKRKIEMFNMIRYGSSKTNTKHANLLKLPKYCLSIFIPLVECNEEQIIPKSPLIIDQNMLFNHITISLSDDDLYHETIQQTSEVERNQMFFLQNSSKLTTLNDNINIYNTTTNTTYANDDDIIDNSSTNMGFSQNESLYNYDFIKK